MSIHNIFLDHRQTSPHILIIENERLHLYRSSNMIGKTQIIPDSKFKISKISPRPRGVMPDTYTQLSRTMTRPFIPPGSPRSAPASRSLSDESPLSCSSNHQEAVSSRKPVPSWRMRRNNAISCVESDCEDVRSYVTSIAIHADIVQNLQNILITDKSALIHMHAVINAEIEPCSRLIMLDTMGDVKEMSATKDRTKHQSTRKSDLSLEAAFHLK